MGTIEDELQVRGIRDSSNYEINLSSTNNIAALVIKGALQEGKSPSLERILEKMDAEKDGCWRAFYQRVPTSQRPKDLEQLGFLYYVFEVVRPALMEVHGTPDGKQAQWNTATEEVKDAVETSQIDYQHR
jgi:hypothetical protein